MDKEKILKPKVSKVNEIEIKGVTNKKLMHKLEINKTDEIELIGQ